MLYGRGTHPIGGAGFDKHGDWLVQAFPHLFYGGSHNGAADPTLLTALSGEHRGAVLWTLLRLTTQLDLFFSGRALTAPGCAWLQHWNPLECSRISSEHNSLSGIFQNRPQRECSFSASEKKTSGQAKNADQTSGLYFSFQHISLWWSVCLSEEMSSI